MIVRTAETAVGAADVRAVAVVVIAAAAAVADGTVAAEAVIGADAAEAAGEDTNVCFRFRANQERPRRESWPFCSPGSNPLADGRQLCLRKTYPCQAKVTGRSVRPTSTFRADASPRFQRGSE